MNSIQLRNLVGYYMSCLRTQLTRLLSKFQTQFDSNLYFVLSFFFKLVYYCPKLTQLQLNSNRIIQFCGNLKVVMVGLSLFSVFNANTFFLIWVKLLYSSVFLLLFLSLFHFNQFLLVCRRCNLISQRSTLFLFNTVFLLFKV